MVEHLIDLGHRRIACITNAAQSYRSSAPTGSPVP